MRKLNHPFIDHFIIYLQDEVYDPECSLKILVYIKLKLESWPGWKTAENGSSIHQDCECSRSYDWKCKDRCLRDFLCILLYELQKFSNIKQSPESHHKLYAILKTLY